MKIESPNFYTVIIGTEILNGRRKDKHFEFVKNELLKRNLELKAVFFIEDDPDLIEKIFNLVKADPNSVMFSFGGIGATPDDYTRDVAAKVFTGGKKEVNEEAKKLIIERFGKDAYPYRIEMSNLPINAGLLSNPVNKVPGFYLERRFFFVPGFPEMAHPMIIEALEKFFPKAGEKTRLSMCVEASENSMIDIMKEIPKDIEFSSLPVIKNGKYSAVISIAHKDKKEAKQWFDYYKKRLDEKGIKYTEGENCR
ncbi:competence/damage-inducible protein A [Nitrosophilus alvini]|uniref:competence/damage-inducible protein A n=1 Tax=Nitrosophilus alvini TaxID=2714855 RepID=UPI001F1E8397|nr:molybdopterin-binding protein [Nitrosophilus alvini]